MLGDTAVSQTISSPLIITRFRSTIQAELEQDEIQPPTELGTDLGHAGHLDEAESLVEPNRPLVRTIDRRQPSCVCRFPALGRRERALGPGQHPNPIGPRARGSCARR